ncbi:MAG: membrane protease YdiL (CAAX protease family), partial [Bradymonadia bacterium]
MTTVATILALGFVTPVALTALPFHLGLAAGTMVGVGGVAAVLFKMTRVVPHLGDLRIRTVGLSAVSGLSLSCFGVGFMALEEYFLPFWAERFDQHSAMMEAVVRADDPTFIPVVLITVALLPALFEEILFRGLLTRYLGAHLSKIGVVLVVGVLFGILHLSPLVLLPLAYVGGLWTVLAQ